MASFASLDSCECDSLVDEAPRDIQHVSPRTWEKYGKRFLLVTLAVCVVASGVAFAHTHAQVSRSDAQEAIISTVVTDHADFGERLSAELSGKSWAFVEAIMNAIVTDGVPADAEISQLQAYFVNQPPAQKAALLGMMELSCNQGGHPNSAIHQQFVAAQIAAGAATQQGAQPGAQQGTPAETGAQQGTPAETGAQQGTPAETGAQEGTPAETGAQQGTPAETGAQQGTPAETGAQQGTPAETGAQEGTPAETGAQQGTPAETGALSSEMQAVLDKHNLYRCMHGVPAFTWDAAIAANAQSWADNGAFGHMPAAQRNINGEQLGENIAWGSPTQSGDVATFNWYSEITDTSPYGIATSGTGANNAVLGHYTQVVWQSSTKLGCGKGRANHNGNDGDFWVCQYGPGGNMGGQFSLNVVAPTQTAVSCGGSATDVPA